MKPPFNIPGRYQFFQEGGDNKKKETNNESKPNFKVSWFEEQVDTFISRRIVSNFHVYNYQQDIPTGSASGDGQQASNTTDKTFRLEKPAMISPDEEKSNDEKSKNDILSNFLEKLLTFSMDKLMVGTSSRNIDLRPCEVVTGINNAATGLKADESQDKGSKSFYDTTEDSPEGSGDVVPLTALETFIKNAMDDSLAKFKEEINKAIDNKFESLRTIPPSITSLSAGDCESKFLTGENLAESLNYSCLGSTDIEDRLKESISADLNNFCESAKNKECHLFNLIRPEAQNIFFGHESANFQSESINVIQKNQSNISLKDPKEELSKGLDPDRGDNDGPNNTTKGGNETYDKGKNDDKQKDDSNSLIVGDSCNPVIFESDLSENCIAEAIKKSANPKLMTDMTKFMYIIFESFRRLKEENLRRELGSTSGSESVNSLYESKTGDETIVAKDEETVLLKDDSKDQSYQTNNEVESNLATKSEISDALPNAELTSEITTVATHPEPSLIGLPGKCRREERPIISMSCNIVSGDNSLTFMPDFEKSEPAILSDINEDSGYAIQKFKKNNIGYKPTTSSKVLENLKELYLQNLNNIEQKMISSLDCGDKYKCQIKKKFSPGESRIGTRLDSKFYCNLRSKTSEKRKSSEVSVRLNSKIRSKGSSNLISVRHSLIKSRNRSAFKSVGKNREISLDSTVISLLDISVKNRSSWLRKLSSFSSETSSEEEHIEEKVNLLKRLCLITFTWGKRHKNITQMMDQHLSNIYNAICLDFVTDDVYKSVLYVSDQLRSGSQKNKDEIMRRWVKICNKPLTKEKKSFNLECLHQIWVQFRTKIWHLARPPPIVPPNFFPALTYPSEENRLIKEQVIQKYARDILEYISDPKLYKHSVSLHSNDTITL